MAIILKTGNWHSVHLPDPPGCVAAADTCGETRDLIQEAAMFHLAGIVEDGEPVP